MSIRNLITNCITAIEVEIGAALSGKASERTIKIFNGQHLRAADQMHIYQFAVAHHLPANYDDAPVIISIGGNRINGNVVGLGEFDVTVALEDYLGKYIAEAALIIDLTFILKALQEKLTEKSDILEGSKVVRRVFGFDSPRITDGPLRVKSAKLNAHQEKALRHSVHSDFLMVWGPPGTGKTHVLGQFLIEQALLGRTTLLVSNTNVAVDQAVGKFLQLSKGNRELAPHFKAGRFVRVGVPQIDDASSLTLDKVLADVNAEVLTLLSSKRAKLLDLESRVTEVTEQLDVLRRLQAVQTELSELQHDKDVADKSLTALNTKRKSVSIELDRIKTQIAESAGKRGLGKMLASISLGKLHKKADDLAKESVNIELDITRTVTQLDTALSELEQKHADVKVDERKAKKAGISFSDYTALETKKHRYAIDIDTLKTEISELETKLQGIRNKVVQDALLIACTCAKSVLDKAISARSFDTVVIDEGSMVSMPQILWSAGLADSRLIVFGDFRQLPPISVIDDKKNPEKSEKKRIMTSSIFEHHGLGGSDNLKSDPCVVMLELQYRMQDSICKLVAGPMYDGRLKTDPSVPSQESNSLYLVDTSTFNAWSDKTEGFSWFNWHHAFVVVELVRKLIKENSDQEITVLTPYLAQVELIRSLLSEAKIDGIAVSTVWRAQGSESKCIIFDTVCAPPFEAPGKWFRDPAGDYEGARLLNVAVTRAKNKLYLIAHSDYLNRAADEGAFSKHILNIFERTATIIDSTDLSRDVLPDKPLRNGAYPIGSFPAGHIALFTDQDFIMAFAHDLQQMPACSTITIFSPFLNSKSVAYWGPHLRDCIQRGCCVEIFTRKLNGKKTLFFEGEDVIKNLIEELERLGAYVGFDNYMKGQRPMHHKLALLRFPPEHTIEPIVWKGSMNVLGHYSSEELMDRMQSQEIYNRVSSLLKLNQQQDRLRSMKLVAQLEKILQQRLGAVCPTHSLPMRLRCSQGRGKGTSYFMGCPAYPKCNNTVNVDTNALNAAFKVINACCTDDGCDSPIEARRGRYSIYIKCTSGHSVNLLP